MQVQPYMFFDGSCEEAIDTYRRALGAEVTMLMRYKEAPEKPPPGAVPEGWDDKVMHASLRIGDSVVMLSDGKSQGGPKPNGYALSVTVANAASAQKTFDALSERGQVVMPLGKTFFAPLFGMTTDRFGVLWMVLQGE
jgi:PhnB protein